jgi:hypothetical protein
MKSRLSLIAIVLSILAAAPSSAQDVNSAASRKDGTIALDRQVYLVLAKAAFARSVETCPRSVEKWRETFDPSTVWGYAPPGGPIYHAGLAASLYDLLGEEEYAREAARWLAGHHRFKEAYPEEARKKRPEYARFLPTLTNFFDLPVFAEAYGRIKGSAAVSSEQRQHIERSIAESADFVFSYPEWGPMNRAILRAEGLAQAARALPDHPDAPVWRKMAKVLASDSWGRWEEEDAQIYHPIWLYSLVRYADCIGEAETVGGSGVGEAGAVGDDTLFEQLTVRYYFDYFLQLLAPTGTLPDFGDGRWNGNWMLYAALFERAAAEYKRPDFRWAASRIYNAMTAEYGTDLGARRGLILTDMVRWTDDSIKPEAPAAARSREVLEDLLGKKIVFRSGWGSEDTYLMLNYRDEGPYARVPRDFLRNTIPVEEEKMHHGHSDENSICLLMNKGSVLLSDAGYRDYMPSGPYGAYREDYFHNRLVVRKDKRGREQPLFEFLRGMGSYNPVVTEKIDFFNFEGADVSRTRLVDARLGYEWDRVIVYIREATVFVVFDIVKTLREDYFTLANLWHGQKALVEGDHHFVTCTDSIDERELSKKQALLIHFVETGKGTCGTFPIMRNRREETAVYQAVSSHYPAGRVETFTTVLTPIDRGAAVAPLVAAVAPLERLPGRNGVGVRIAAGGAVHFVGVKTDLVREILTENVRPRYTFDSGRVRYGPFETDASVLHARLEGKTLDWSAANMVKVYYKDRELFSARPSTFSLEPDDLATGYGPPKWRWWEDRVEVE